MQELFLLRPDAGIALAMFVGLAGGWFFHRIWRRVMPKTRSRAFWDALPRDLRGMLGCDEPEELVRYYRSLLVTLARFAARNTLAIAAGLVPVTLGFLIVEGLGVAEHFESTFEQPLSPWLSHLEFWFCVAVMVGSAVAAWTARRAKAVGA